MKRVATVFCCLLLSACADDLRAGIHKLSNEINNKHDSVSVLPAVTRYCYRSFSDTLCYTQPQPGMEDRLVGYQEPLVPVGKIYDRRTQPPPHLDTSLPKEADNVKKPVPLKSVEVGSEPAVKGAEPVKYDASALEPRELITQEQ